MKEWINTHPHDPMLLTMHDCTVTRIDLETSEDSTRMVWHLPDGIWVAPEVAGEGIQKTCRTAEPNPRHFERYPMEHTVKYL